MHAANASLVANAQLDKDLTVAYASTLALPAGTTPPPLSDLEYVVLWEGDDATAQPTRPLSINSSLAYVPVEGGVAVSLLVSTRAFPQPGTYTAQVHWYNMGGPYATRIALSDPAHVQVRMRALVLLLLWTVLLLLGSVRVRCNWCSSRTWDRRKGHTLHDSHA